MAQILIVDDSETSRERVKKLLLEKGYQVLSASNGDEGILTFKNNPEINLIICDQNMPEMDGVTMCEEIRATEGARMTPVLMLTTRTGEREVKERAKAAGIVAWALKPFDENTVSEVIEKILKKP